MVDALLFYNCPNGGSRLARELVNAKWCLYLFYIYRYARASRRK